MEKLTIRLWVKAEIHTQSLTYNDGPLRWGYWLTVDREEIASEGLQFGKFDTEAAAIKAARYALRKYQREAKERAGR